MNYRTKEQLGLGVVVFVAVVVIIAALATGPSGTVASIDGRSHVQKQ
ncbi:hypothetical protein G3O06_03545 [Burkholderia sp. Ac-20345]|nr:hypothetical protein [Burkholderia sp. Ac-20345]MBN3776640.1 hypothetical protein [Burkholderia sp. Ac-20345]